MFEGFAADKVETEATTIFVRWSGSGPPLLLLHGFPQTHVMWREVAPRLTDRHTVICADLRGYGHSGCPVSDAEHRPYAKRAMAQDLIAVMQHFGFDRFAVTGHDRGGRVAYRLALDHPDRVERLAVLDIVPTSEVWDRSDARLALAFWPWSLLAQPEPLPERLLAAAPEAFVDNALSGWGSPAPAFTQEAREAYIQALRDPAHAHAICEEYRAAASIDRTDDKADRCANRRIKCPTLVLWSSGGAVDTWYAKDGGPLALWRAWCDDARGQSVEGGHFFPEAAPGPITTILRQFFTPVP